MPFHAASVVDLGPVSVSEHRVSALVRDDPRQKRAKVEVEVSEPGDSAPTVTDQSDYPLIPAADGLATFRIVRIGTKCGVHFGLGLPDQDPEPRLPLPGRVDPELEEGFQTTSISVRSSAFDATFSCLTEMSMSRLLSSRIRPQ